MRINFFKFNRGFTLVELMVSVGIFAMMTALFLAKYGNFNQGILLNNLAYDVALTIRNAQSYGLNVKSTGRISNEFYSPFGVHFSSQNNKNTEFIFFADTNSNNKLDGSDIEISTTNIRRNSYIKSLCVGDSEADCSNNIVNTLDITFVRPDPNAIIKGGGAGSERNYAEITLSASDGTTKKIIVRSTGQIAVQN